MKITRGSFWGKKSFPSDDELISWLSIEDHSVDVAACFQRIISQPVIERKLAAFADRKFLGDILKQRLCVFTALHDIGKYNIGFQNKALTKRTPTAGHVREILSLIYEKNDEYWKLLDSLDVEKLIGWGSDETVLRMLITSVSHHGKPYKLENLPRVNKTLWMADYGLDPFKGIAKLSAHIQSWFPEAFQQSDIKLPDNAGFQHCFSGLVTLVDWLGSSKDFFPHNSGAKEDRFRLACARAEKAVTGIGLDISVARKSLGATTPSFSNISKYAPRPAQQKLLDIPLDERGSLLILEAETGSGKTEAAIARFLQLFHAGLVEGIYFALPTRTAATQIHTRIKDAVERAFPDRENRPPVVLAVPGYIKFDDVTGKSLPNFDVLWDDNNGEKYRYRGWAAEQPKRYLAGSIVVGTIDQALLSSLTVKHAHLRASSLLRHFLVVDEVHASDAYMTAILRTVVHRHLDANGHVMMMSATLGSDAKARMKRGFYQNNIVDISETVSEPYPVIINDSPTLGYKIYPIEAAGEAREISVKLIDRINEYENVARKALEASEKGARVLVLRNTVKDCIATQQSIEKLTLDKGRLFKCNGIVTLHHSRFAREDRKALDDSIVKCFSSQNDGKGFVACATQTVQQSLDLDADFLITDLCPMDVLLQRIGRLHRHKKSVRPAGYENAQVLVLTPDIETLDSLLNESGRAKGVHGLGSVYRDIRILEATMQLLAKHKIIKIPEMGRELVELTTHTQALEDIVKNKDKKWKAHGNKIKGELMAEKTTAALRLVDWTQSFGDFGFPDFDTERTVQTRLGQNDMLARFEQPFNSPFGQSISILNIPVHLVGEIDANLEPRDIDRAESELKFTFGKIRFVYNRLGLQKLEEPQP